MDINNQSISKSKNILNEMTTNNIKIILSKVFTDIDLAILAPIGMLDNNTNVQIKLTIIMS